MRLLRKLSEPNKGEVFGWTPHLAARSDFEEVEPEKKTEEAIKTSEEMIVVDLSMATVAEPEVVTETEPSTEEIVRAEAEDKEKQEARIKTIVAIIPGLSMQDFIMDGRPRIQPLSELTGFLDITGAERDVAWNTYKETKG